MAFISDPGAVGREVAEAEDVDDGLERAGDQAADGEEEGCGVPFGAVGDVAEADVEEVEKGDVCPDCDDELFGVGYGEVGEWSTGGVGDEHLEIIPNVVNGSVYNI